MYSKEEYDLAKEIVSTIADDWDAERKAKGVWPEEHKKYKIFQNYSVQELKEHMHPESTEVIEQLIANLKLSEQEITKLMLESAQLKGDTTALLTQLPSDPDIYENAKIVDMANWQFQTTTGDPWDAPWNNYRNQLHLPETASIKNAATPEQKRATIQDIFNDHFIKKTADKTQECAVINSWTFFDTHKSAFEKTTQDCLMALHSKTLNYCSIGLVIELMGQNVHSLPDKEHKNKIIRDMLRIHYKKNFEGCVFGVVTDLARLVAIRVSGPVDDINLERTNLFTDQEVERVMNQFVRASPEGLGIHNHWLQTVTFTLVNGSQSSFSLAGVLGSGKQGRAYRVAGHSDWFVKAFTDNAVCLHEEGALTKVIGVPDVVQLLGKHQGGPDLMADGALLCQMVGTKLGSNRRKYHGNISVVCQLGARFLKALVSIHERNVLHRDISPNNLYGDVDDVGVVQSCFIADFGCSVPKNGSVAYSGSLQTAANDVLAALATDRLQHIVYTPAMDLEALVKSLWLLYSAECDAMPISKNSMTEHLQFWERQESSAKERIFLVDWLAAARSYNVVEMQELFQLVPRTAEKPAKASILKRAKNTMQFAFQSMTNQRDK